LEITFTAGVTDSSTDESQHTTAGSTCTKSSRPSLTKILLSLEGNAAKQQALGHVLQALQIHFAR